MITTRTNVLLTSRNPVHFSLRKLYHRVDDFLHGLYTKSVETRGTYQRALRQFLKWCEIDQKFRFRVKDVERFKLYLTNRKQLSEVSVSTYLTALRRFCQHLVDGGTLKENPAKHVGGNRRPMTHSRVPLGYTDVEKLLESIDNSTLRGVRDYAMIKTMLGCGLSGIEMIRANVEDIRHLQGKTVLSVQGKGHNAKDQVVVIPSDVKDALDLYLATREKPEPKQALFLSAGNKVRGKRMTTRGMRERVNYYLKRAGIKRNRSRRITPFSLRHTAALMMVDAGASAEDIQQRFRLGSIATATIYVNQKGKLEKK